MMELTQGGKNPLTLPSGETRAFLEDGDCVVQKGYCQNETHARIGFGDAAGAIRP
jgi:fumarylacetoacetase